MPAAADGPIAFVFAMPIELAPLVHETAQALRALRPEKEITVTMPAAKARVLGDATQLHRALLNVGKNAIDAVRDDGRVFFTPTVYKGTPAIRAAISNWQTGEADGKLAFEVLQAVYRAHALKISI